MARKLNTKFIIHYNNNLTISYKFRKVFRLQILIEMGDFTHII